MNPTLNCLIFLRTRIACIAVLEKRRNVLELKEQDENKDMNLEKLPEECVREILCKLSDHKDVENAGSIYLPTTRVCKNAL